MNRNEQPQIAPSTVNSSGVRQSRSTLPAASGAPLTPGLRKDAYMLE